MLKSCQFMASIQDIWCHSFCELLWDMVSLFVCLHQVPKYFCKLFIFLPSSPSCSLHLNMNFTFTALVKALLGTLTNPILLHIVGPHSLFSKKKIFLEYFIKSQHQHCAYIQNLHHMDYTRFYYQLGQWIFEPTQKWSLSTGGLDM